MRLLFSKGVASIPARSAPAGSPGSVSGLRACSVWDTGAHWVLCGIRRVARGTTIPAPELCRLRSDSSARERPALRSSPDPATGPGALPEPGRRVSSAQRTASSRAEEPPPAGMPLPASAGSRRPGASRCPSFGRSHGPNAEGTLNFSQPFDSLGQRQGTHEVKGTEGRVALEIRLLCLCLCGPDIREDRSWSDRRGRLMQAQRPEPFSLKARIGGSDSALPSRSCPGQGVI
ncbi:uncharacterized protein LOC116072759 [Mastomys coucha]|uniref:uncharacterized protein LOC116072759 n=1 Tax=Mastomys coucha TaxID=35658 RepID=UPI0012619447|nr:uncharacterized protein LOC116072759 [Mastomys coucha]